MDKLVNSKSFKLLRKYRANLINILLLGFLIWQDYINGEGNTFVVGVMATLLLALTAVSLVDITLSYLLK